jgi:hypothetical protein
VRQRFTAFRGDLVGFLQRFLFFKRNWLMAS